MSLRGTIGNPIGGVVGLLNRLFKRKASDTRTPQDRQPSTDTDRPYTFIAAGDEAARAGDFTLAEKQFRQGIDAYRRAEPDSVDFALGRYGAFLLGQRRLDEAVSVLREAIKRKTDIPAIWGDYVKLLAQRHDIDGMFDAVDQMQAIPSLQTNNRDAETLLSHARAASRAGEHEFSEAIARRVMTEATSRRDKATRWAAAGDLGQILEQANRLPEAMEIWEKAFASGSDDPTTANRLSMNLERAKDFHRAADVCRVALERSLQANVEEQLRKRLERCEAKVDPAKRRSDVAAYSIRHGDGFMQIGFQLRVKPPVKDLEVVGNLARCFGTSKGVGSLIDIDLTTGQETRRVEGLPDLDNTWFTSSGWGIGIERTARVGGGPTELTFISPSGGIVQRTSVPDATSQIAAGPELWYVGCRDGHLYGFDVQGSERWAWETPGLRGYDGDPYFRPCPYYVSAAGSQAVIASMGNIYSVGTNGKTLWSAQLPNEKETRYTYSVPAGNLPSLDQARRTLGLAPAASSQDVKRAYLSLAKQSHPDLHPGDPTAASRFRDVQAAYESIRSGRDQPTVTITVEIRGFGPTASFITVAQGGCLVGSSQGRVYLFDTRGHIRQARVFGEGYVLGALREDGSLAAAWCDGVLSFVQGDAVINAIEVPDHPGRLDVFGDNLILWHGNRVEIVDQRGQPLWIAEFSKRLVGLATRGSTLVTASGNLTMFNKTS